MRIARLREDEVKVAQGIHGADNAAARGGDKPGERSQDALDLLLFRKLRLAPAIVEFYDRQGLDEQGGAGPGLVVDEPGDAPLEFGAQGDDITPLALRDNRLLQELRIGGRPDDSLEALHQVRMCVPQLAADAQQRIAGGVQHLPALVDAAADLVDHVAGHHDALGHVGDVRELLRQPAEHPAQRTRANQGRADREQVHGGERAPDGGLLDQRAQIVNAAQVHVAFLIEQPSRLARFGLPDDCLADVIRRQQCERTFPPEREGGVFCQPLPDLVELQHAESSCVHVAEYSTAARSGQCFRAFRSCGIMRKRFNLGE